MTLSQEDKKMARGFREYVERGIAGEVEKMMGELGTVEAKVGWKAREMLEGIVCRVGGQVVGLLAPSSVYYTTETATLLNIPLYSSVEQL
jgi:hypothetical protein